MCCPLLLRFWTLRNSKGIVVACGAGLVRGVHYFLYNGHGDVVQLTNTAGSLIKNYDYGAFGNESSILATDANLTNLTELRLLLNQVPCYYGADCAVITGDWRKGPTA